MRLSTRWTEGTRGGRDEGLTLMELMVAMLVSSIVLTFVATVTIQAFRIQRDTLTREKDSTSASLAMETITRDLRQALAPQLNNDGTTGSTTDPAFSVASSTSLTVITWVGDNPVQITYTLSDGTLTRRVRQPDDPGLGVASRFSGAGASTSAVLVKSVSTSATAPLFDYYNVKIDDAGNKTYTRTQTLADINIVDVALTVDSDASTRLPGTTLANRVVCLNL